jgi:hypothetical protein
MGVLIADDLKKKWFIAAFAMAPSVNLELETKLLPLAGVFEVI